MLKELKLTTPQSKSSHSTIKQKIKYPNSMSCSQESTFFKTNRFNQTDREKDDPILENLKYFVKNSPSITKFDLSRSDVFAAKSSVHFFPKDYKTKESILTQILNEDNYKNEMNRKKNTRSMSSSSFFNYDKKDFKTDNVRDFEDVISELKFSVFEKISREIHEKTKKKNELENNIKILTNRLSMAGEKLNQCKSHNLSTMKNSTKLEYFNDRVNRENNHMDLEIPQIKKRVDQMRNEIFERDRESRQIKYQIYREETELTYLQEETRRVGKNVIDLQSEKKNLMTAIILLKKQNDRLKERVIKQDSKSKEIIQNLSVLVNKGKLSI